MAVDWPAWQKHVNYVIETRGRWYGIGDADGNPLYDLPDPLNIEAPDQWMDSPDLKFEMPALTPEGSVSRPAKELVIDGITGFDKSGKPIYATTEGYTLLCAMRGPDGKTVRRGGMITHATASDDENDGLPNKISIHALNAMDVWKTIPAVSWPAAWWAATPYKKTSDESGIEYKKPHWMARIELATRATFVWKKGKAGFVIRRLAQESLDAVGFTQVDPDGTRWVDSPYHIVEVPEVDNSPEIQLLARDGMLWDTVADQAKNAGVILGARLYWPGDPPVRSWSLAKSTMSPAEVDISPSQGESKRTVVEQSFPHAMIVLTVKQIGA